MAAIAPLTTFMGGKMPRDKIPMKPVKTGKSTVDTNPHTPPKKSKRPASPLSMYAARK